MSDPKQAKKYTLLKNPKDELLLVLDSCKVAPGSTPHVLYDGGLHAIFYRDDENTIILDYIHPNVQKILAKCAEIYVGELDDENLAFDYMAKVEHVKKLPDVEKYFTEKPNVEAALKKFGIKA